MRAPPRIFRILLVCTGNQCRSPAAERMLGRLLISSTASRFELDSVGTLGPEGLPIHPATAASLERRGVPVEGHQSRVISPGKVSRADLVLVAERLHRSAVLHADGSARTRTFTINEFALLADRLAPLDPVDPWDLVAAAHAYRGTGSGSDAADVLDPIHGSATEHESTVRKLQESVTVIATALLATSGQDTAGSRGRHRA